ncbi:hypothetical protein OIV83_002527 [Microbotryomycetes sp. JL201]|nr:hypothetical protein OIV83_002527 [Microbotryomycetes sp. JL201]
MSSSFGAPRRPPGKGVGRVKAPRKHVQSLDETLQRVEEAIRQIQQHQASKLAYEAVYRDSYNLVLYKHGHTLYNSAAALTTEHLEKETKERIVPVFPPMATTDSLASGTESSAGPSSSSNVQAASAAELFLDRVKDVWDDHIACMSKLRRVFTYMDNHYTASSSLPGTWDLGLSLFFHHVVLFSTDPRSKASTPTSKTTAASRSPGKSPTTDPSSVAFHLLKTMLDVIRIERDGEVVSRHSLRNAVMVLCELTDEGHVPLPVTASQGTGSGVPVLGVGLGGGAGRGAAVLGDPGVLGQSPYKTTFEKEFLRRTEEYYARESARLLVENDCPTFLKKIHRRLEEEAERAQTYLAPSTEPLLVELLERVLISTHISAILEHPASGLSTLIQESRLDDLRLLYNLFGRVREGHVALQASMSKWIIDIGTKINEGLLARPETQDNDDDGSQHKSRGNKGKERATDVDGAAEKSNKPARPAPKETSASLRLKAAIGWVQNVLDLKDKFDTILQKACSADMAFEKSINDAFSVFVNQNNKSPEFISLFIDDNLKKGLKGKSEAEVDDVLNRAVALFRFLVEKDTFEKYYNNHLARRLINQKSVSDDAERNMLAKFKVEAGSAFTKASEGMMKDIKLSEETLSEFKRQQSRPSTKIIAPFAMEPIICGTNNWPVRLILRPTLLALLTSVTLTNLQFSGIPSCTLPRILTEGVDAFSAFYNTKHSGRKLTFRPEHGHVEVKTRFKARTHELTVSTFAMCVLALFESLTDDETLSYEDIAKTTHLETNELKRTLQSLACGKFKILTKHPKGRDVDNTDSFSFNSGFVSNMQKIKIQTIANKVETPEERRETEEKLEAERGTLCDACVVRVMKDRKTLQHQELVNEVIRQLSHRFQPRPSMIKQSIERLIEKEYLERDEDDRRKLRYLA